MNNRNLNIYFGAGGGGISYCKHTGKLPDFFVDNDKNKWGSELLGIKILSPEDIDDCESVNWLITSGYVKEIFKQLQKLGISEDRISIPPKSLLGSHPFRTEANRREATTLLVNVIRDINKEFKLVAVGGVALGFCRDGDFIHWDFDIDLFAPVQFKSRLFDILQKHQHAPFYENNDSMRAEFVLMSGEKIPLGIDFFDANASTYLDCFEDYSWSWPTEMFTNCEEVNIHGETLYVPSPHTLYLSKVYGKTWNVPNPEFRNTDYADNS